MSKVAIVTGSNKGIGYQIVKELAEKVDGIVYLTSRDEGRGSAALAKAKSEIPSQHASKLRLQLLDVDSEASIKALAEFIKKEHGKLDILVNNAGLAVEDLTIPFSDIARRTCQTNYWGVRKCIEAFLPLMAKDGRIVTVASTMGLLSKALLPEPLWESFVKTKTPEEVDAAVKNFVAQAESGELKEKILLPGIKDHSAYAASKTGTIALTEFISKEATNGVLINCCCPGYVYTDMTQKWVVSMAPRTLKEGAVTPVILATLPAGKADNPQGQFIIDGVVTEWRKGMTVLDFVAFVTAAAKK